MNFKQYIKENDKLKAFQKFTKHADTDFQIWQFLETEYPAYAQEKTLVKGSHPWERTRDFVHSVIHDPEVDEYGIHWYGERERAKWILNSFLDRNGFFEGI